MDGEEIGLVLARASDLRSRISACAAAARPRDAEEAVKRLGAAEDDEGEEEEEDEVDSLVGISDALESLERQLAALQDLQHQQSYERETMLSHIDRSRRSLLTKLKEYKGPDCEVIHEAAAFAGEKIDEQHDDDDGLVLPPYSNHVTNSFGLDDLYPLNFLSKSKHVQNRVGSNGTDQRSTRASNDGSTSRGGIGSFVGWLAKTAVMVVGAVSITKAAAAGYAPLTGRNHSVNLDVGRLFGKDAGGGQEWTATVLCPPGKMMVVEDGRAHCVVKERVEVPFDTNLATPSASYGLG